MHYGEEYNQDRNGNASVESDVYQMILKKINQSPNGYLHAQIEMEPYHSSQRGGNHNNDSEN